MLLQDAAFDGDLEALRDRIERGDDVDGREGGGNTPLMWACVYGHHECAQALINANAAVDKVDNDGSTALMDACRAGHLECAQTMIDAGAAVDMVDNNGRTALMWTCDLGRHECTRALIDAQADLELTNRDGQNALIIACKSPPSNYSQSQRQGKIRCALAILAATAPIEVADFPDRAASLKFACERLQLIAAVLASTHVIEDAPQLASVRDLQTDAQGVVVSFAHARAIAKLPSREISAVIEK